MSSQRLHKQSKIYVAGHTGMVGSAIVRQLANLGFSNILKKSHTELDLLNQADTLDFLLNEKPEFIFLAAAKVGGINANNKYRAEFIYENLMVQANVIHSAYTAGVKRLLFLGSSCIYPRNCPQPISEDSILSGPLETTNEPYAIAKIAGIKLCENYNKQYGTKYFSVMPTNLYGPNDNYDLNTSHVLPALIHKVHNAKIQNSKEIIVWGTGTVKRDFLYVDDLADACIFLMKNNVTDGIFNIGTGSDMTVHELCRIISHIIGYQGNIIFDHKMPDGTPRKLLDIDKINKMGWAYKTDLQTGIKKTYDNFLETYKDD